MLKPSELTSVSALELGEIADKAGLPAGVLNVVTGFGAEAGQPLTEHPGVDKLASMGRSRPIADHGDGGGDIEYQSGVGREISTGGFADTPTRPSSGSCSEFSGIRARSARPPPAC